VVEVVEQQDLAQEPVVQVDLVVEEMVELQELQDKMVILIKALVVEEEKVVLQDKRMVEMVVQEL
jgi:hypothetical protein